MKKASVIIPFYNAQKYIIEAIESIIEQTMSFDDIALFLIDDGSTDKGSSYGESYAQRYENIVYVFQTHKGVSAARNQGIELALAENSEFVFFLDADDKYHKSHIEQCIDILEEYPESIFVSGVTCFFEGKNKLDDEYTLPTYKQSREINTIGGDTSPVYVGHVAQGGWRAAILEDYRFNEEFSYSEDIDFISRILLNNKFVFSNKIKYLYRIRHTNDSVINQGNLHLQWYERVWKIFKVLYEEGVNQYGCVPAFLQKTVFKNLCSLFSGGQDDAMMQQIDYPNLEQAMQFIMEHTDHNIVESQELNYWQKMYFFTMKYGEPHITRWAPMPMFVLNRRGDSDVGERFGYLGTDPLAIHIINEKQGILIIRASMRCLTYEHFELDVKSDFEVTVMEVPEPFDIDKHFFANKEVFPKKYYEIKIKLQKPLMKSKEGMVRFFLKTDYNTSINTKLEMLPLSGMGYDMPFTLGDQYIIKRTSQNNCLDIIPLSERELYDACAFINPYDGMKTVETFHILKESILNAVHTFSNKRIWLFMDRGHEIGNNAEVLFRHCVHKDDGIQKYYIIPDESYAPRFSGLPYMVFGTLEYKLLCCFAEKFISSFLFDEGITLQFGVDAEETKLYEDIQNFKRITHSFFRGDIIHLQHGVIMQDISFYLNKFHENTRLLCNVSTKEHTYVTNQLTHAIDVNIPKLTGLPKYDLLESTKKNSISQKIILFAPSFDRNHTAKDKYKEEYQYSKHFQYISDIINGKSLIDMLEEKGYTLYFKPHYVLRKQMEDFKIDSRVRLVTDELALYDLYAITDLLITDYSSVAFDFAYLEKPVLYAHFLDRPKFKETYFSYQEQGFGDICCDITSLIEVLQNTISQKCTMQNQYKERVNNFYTFHDENNCQRVYDEISKMPDTRRNFLN